MYGSGDTTANIAWYYYKEQTNDHILAYAVELTGVQEGRIRGNIYELDYAQYYEYVKCKGVEAGEVKLIYEKGTRKQPMGKRIDSHPDPQFGTFESFEIQPKSQEALSFLLREEKQKRDKLKPGDFMEHIEILHRGLIEREAQHVVSDMKKLSAPNSPDGSHFMTELSPVFMCPASSKDLDSLFAMLPYKTLSFSAVENRYGTYAVIGKWENRDRKIRKYCGRTSK